MPIPLTLCDYATFEALEFPDPERRPAARWNPILASLNCGAINHAAADRERRYGVGSPRPFTRSSTVQARRCASNRSAAAPCSQTA